MFSVTEDELPLEGIQLLKNQFSRFGVIGRAQKLFDSRPDGEETIKEGKNKNTQGLSCYIVVSIQTLCTSGISTTVFSLATGVELGVEILTSSASIFSSSIFLNFSSSVKFK